MIAAPTCTSQIQLSKRALKKNLRFIRRWIGEGVRLWSVVKGNAYGHGIEQLVPAAEQLGVRHFAVFDAYEAWRVLDASTGGAQVMVMGMVDRQELEWAISNGVEVYLFDRWRLEQAIELARQLRRPARVHLELETGLNRTGFAEDQLDQVGEQITANAEHLAVEGVCTHYAGAESISNHLRVQRQITRFGEACQRLQAAGVNPRCRHTACSAATLAYPETIMDGVRVGILQYGYWPSEETRIHYLRSTGRLADNPLRRVIRWSSRIMGIKRVPAGEFVGYGTTYIAARAMTVATVPVGYAHGYARSLSNQGRVLVRGRRVGVVGTVNMNLIIINVSHVPGVEPGDEVVLIGSQGRSAIPVSSFGELSNQLNYELLTRLPRDIPREVTA